MKPIISLGTQSFEFLRKNNCFFVDKTGLIEEWWENRDAVTLITRPRRFGKTLNMNMLECFFSSHYENCGDLFEGLSIWEKEEYRSLQGTYPVISLSFASVKGTTYHSAREGIIRAVRAAYRSHADLLKEGRLSPQEREYFLSLDRYVLDLNPQKSISDELVSGAVNELSFYLFRHYGKKALILLDEYDTPLQEAWVNGYWEEMVCFVRSLFNATFKTNSFMERGLLTGITRISKESIFSDLNNLTVITTTSEMYCTRFGFTQEEVFEALDVFGMSEEKENVKAWYDGFTFGSRKGIYNPWSITGFLKDGIYRPYWANSSSNNLINDLICQGSPQTKTSVEDLMAGRALTTQLDEEVVFDQLARSSASVWSLLLAGGYLKVEERIFDRDRNRFLYRLMLTNLEVQMMFEDMIRGWFSQEDVPYNAFLRALLAGDVDYMNVYMNEVARLTFSNFDTGNRPSGKANPERFYHGFVLGLIVELAGKYRISSNRESGFGRYDIMIEPLENEDPAFVLEFKVKNPEREAALEDTLAQALAQIEKKNYDAELEARGIARERIRHYGFVFEGKRVLIGGA